MLAPEQISALTSNGANRWQRDTMDRLYINVGSLGFQVRREYDDDKQVLIGYLNGDLVSPSYITDILKNTRVWIDVNTEQVGIKPGRTSLRNAQRDQRAESEYLATLRQNADRFIEAAYGMAEQEAAEQRAKSISAAALKWRKGSLLNIEGKTYQVTDVDTIGSPTPNKSSMRTRVRLTVMLHDGHYRWFDLEEIPQQRG